MKFEKKTVAGPKCTSLDKQRWVQMAFGTIGPKCTPLDAETGFEKPFVPCLGSECPESVLCSFYRHSEAKRQPLVSYKWWVCKWSCRCSPFTHTCSKTLVLFFAVQQQSSAPLNQLECIISVRFGCIWSKMVVAGQCLGEVNSVSNDCS